MRTLIAACGILAGVLVVSAQTPATRVRAQEKPAQEKAGQGKAAPQLMVLAAPAARPIDPAKEANIRALLEVTGAAHLGEQVMKSMLEQFRTSFSKSLPENERATQFMNAFLDRFQKRFDPQLLTEGVVPIYDKYFTDDDLKGLLQFYRSPLGQRTVKVLPEIVQESQAMGASLGQMAAMEVMEEMKGDYPEFFPDSKQEPEKP